MVVIDMLSRHVQVYCLCASMASFRAKHLDNNIQIKEGREMMKMKKKMMMMMETVLPHLLMDN